VRWKRGLEAQVNFSGFCSNSLSFRWQPPADFSVHLPETTAFIASSSCCTSTGFEEKTGRVRRKLAGEHEIRLEAQLGEGGHDNERTLSGLELCVEGSHFVRHVVVSLYHSFGRICRIRSMFSSFVARFRAHCYRVPLDLDE